MQPHQVAPHHGQFRKFGQHVNSGNVKTDLSATETAWKLWELMGEVYSNRWTQKNLGRTFEALDCTDWCDD